MAAGAALALKARLRTEILIGGLWVFIVGLCVYKAWLIIGGAQGARLYTPDTHSDPILIGCLAGLAYSFGRVSRVPAVVASGALAVGVVIIATLAEVISAHHMLGRPLFATAAAIVVLAAVLEPRWWFRRLVDRVVLRGVGKISYGLYLWHVPIFLALGWKVGLPVSIAVALLSYRFVEQPFLRRKRRAGGVKRVSKIELAEAA